MDDSAPPMRSPSAQPRPSQSVNEREIAARVMTLLSHYWTAADSPEFRKLQMNDWLDDLSPFPAMFVAEACKDWRQTQTRRPTPAEILKLTREAKANWDWKNAPARPQIAHHRQPYKPPPHVVREEFRMLRVESWTAAELEIANRELDAKAIAAGFPAGPGGRLAFVKSQLHAGSFGKIVERAVGDIGREFGVPPAKEIPPPVHEMPR